ncbi:ATP-binding cassette domain-containing protein [Kribbella turkmenica]|uniref:ATP-binding cassette domain-containing protein n=1 Tax=Kribbella turkmenica TaxID=2530375 RepID=A0A4R4WBW8_9ACTN|nr:ATP-binding cassette domain-containing protein [Kribbella turkmenica]TDD13444.1 ATP-binding cassette domain-containing protein [Kribbella turkmenica]
MAEHAVEARGLIRTFDDGTGIRGVDLAVTPGEVHALVGLNGAGKSTLMRLVLGMLAPTAGTVTIAGRGFEQTDWSRVGHLVEYPLAYRELTCRQNLVLGARLHGVMAEEIVRMVDATIAELGLSQYADRRTGKLSLGNRQRLGLASALQHNPGLIVLDEPTNTLDPAGVILLREALLRRADVGAGILVSSHHLDEVARIAQRISVLNAGRIIGTLDPRGVDLERSFFELVRRDDVAA